MQTIELMKYLGISYQQLMDSPAWVRQVAQIRLAEESSYAKYRQDHPGK